MDGLVKIRIALAPDAPFATEGLWARYLGQDLYEIDNIPFFAYNLHCGDVVRAIASAPSEQPNIQEVVERGGHSTLRILFTEDKGSERQEDILQWLDDCGAAFEGLGSSVYDGRYFAIDVEPDADYPSVCAQLYQWELDGLLVYETGALDA